MKLHINYCNSFGISESEIQATQELQGKPPPPLESPFQSYKHINTACTAYTRYVLDIGQSEDWLALQMALAPCLLGYGAVAKMLHAHADTVRDGNTYWAWIENYNADDYVEAVRLGSGA
jgi:hydroxymethylpyrimidine/phosphomethylpyrimidine kinase